jgi:D-amino-acid dehydrogenase
MNGGRVVIVGGGVIGAACAYYLRQAGREVTIIDRGEFGQGCSHANCGYVCPSHVLPHAGPGALGPALKALLTPNSPLTIKPRFDPALWGWLIRFARRCNRRSMLDAGQAIKALLDSSRRLYDDLMRVEMFDVEWEEKGLLFVYQTAHAFEHYAQIDRLLRDEFCVPAERWDAATLAEKEPALLPGLPGAWFYPGDAQLRPDRLMDAWRRWLISHGVEIRERCELLGFTRQGRTARAAETSNGTIAADAVVVATGAWTPLLRRHLGGRLPIQPGKGYSITMPRPDPCPNRSMIFEEHRVAVTPFRSGYRLGSTMEFAGHDATLNRRRLELLTRGAAHYLRAPTAAPIQEEWWGWRPMVYDGLPIIGPSVALENVVIAAGHGMLGLSMAPATGRLVAEILSGQPPHLDPAPYRATRFG